MTLPASPPRLLTLILLSALAVLPVNMFLPSLPHIAREFQSDYGAANLAIAGYAAAAAILQLVMGPLSDRFGRRPVLLLALIVFVLASIGCALATNIWSFLLYRLTQATVIACYSVSLAVIRDCYPEQKAASLIGYVAMAWSLAPMLGPVIGGALDQAFGWRANLWVLATLGSAVLLSCWKGLPETNLLRSVTILQAFASYPELLRSQRFWSLSLCMAFSIGTFYAFLGGAPLVAQVTFAMSPMSLGIAMGSITAGFLLGSFLSGRYASRYVLTTTMIAGRVIACIGLGLGLALALSGPLSALSFFGWCMFVGLGNGLTLPSANAGAMSVRPRLAGSAAGLSGALTVAGGAMVSSVTGAVLTETNAEIALLAIMLLSALLGLAAAVHILFLDRRDQAIASRKAPVDRPPRQRARQGSSSSPPTA